MRNVIKAVIVTTAFIATTNVAMAADNKKVAECLVVATVANKTTAAKRALALADNQRVALAEANNIMDFLGRLPKERRQSTFNNMMGACAKIGVAL